MMEVGSNREELKLSTISTIRNKLIYSRVVHVSNGRESAIRQNTERAVWRDFLGEH